jgi:hypothetical protein
MKKKDKKIEVGSLYDLNKQVISQLPEMPQEQIQEQLIQIQKWFSNSKEKYFMLLCREKSDYTLFNFNGKKIPDIFPEFINKMSKHAIKELETCIKNRGILMSINKARVDAWEIWIKDFFNKEINMYMLFECDQMVIEV